jgi:RNA polymerase sigma-70 factor, ECF subfamily
VTADHPAGARPVRPGRPGRPAVAAPSPDAELVDRAVDGDRRAFERLVAAHRAELHVHCYRMLGSLHDADDMVQEALLRAWRNLGSLRDHGSVRAWLYKIATNTCLNELRKRPGVVVPSGYEPAGPAAPPPLAEVPWLEPYPDRLLAAPAAAPDPGDEVTRRMTTSLAFLAAVQLLPARQRAVLILRDVLAFSAAEVAELLDTSPTAVDSALQRARRRLDAGIRDQLPLAAPGSSTSGEEDRLVAQFVAAWERTDIDALVALLTDDAVLAMPPMPAWYRGRDAIGEFFATVPAGGHLDQIRLVPTRANGTAALAAYAPDPPTGQLRAYGIMLFSAAGGAITGITGFPDPGLFSYFELPQSHPPANGERTPTEPR